ncbi:MAG TPA: hypothetical protein VMT47_07335, partial [Polyangia bacterium]|nr:hypothetical protein [Polyangia bacterium]
MPLGWQAGVAPPQSASPAQSRQVCVVASQVGRLVSHCALVRQPPQVPEPTSQRGVAPVHAVVFVAEHAAQAPLGWQAGVAPPHWPSVVQPRQVCVVVSQTGLVPPHWALESQVSQMPFAASQVDDGPVQALLLVAEQTPQAPFGWQAGVAPPQSASPAQPRQTCMARLQTGVAPPHWAFATQTTQVPLPASQAGVVPPQRVLLVAEQEPQAPLGWQAGVAPPQLASLAQPRQTCAPRSQTGVAPAQSAFEAQPTHVPLGRSQVGVAPAHVVLLVAEQGRQAPLAWQAGVAPPQSPSRTHGPQVCVATSQTGAVPPHWELDTQGTQVEVVTSQAGRVPVHLTALPAEHWPQAPLASQAGVAAPHSPSAAQGRQVWVTRSHTGVVPAQSAPEAQATHVPVARLQARVAPVHWVAFVAEHWPQAPPGWQAGVAPPQSASAAHARQVWVAVLQTGVAPEQSASRRQRTQTPAVISQRGVAPVHAVVLLAEHWAHAPVAWQAGVLPPHSASPAQARHVCVAPS